MHITNSILRHKHSTNIRKNPFLIIPLGVAAIIVSMPHNALAFESKVVSEQRKSLRAYASVVRNVISDEPLVRPLEQRPTFAIATSSPVTVEGTWEEPKPPVRIVLAQSATAAAPLPQVPQITPEVAPTATPAPGTPVATLEGEASYYSRAGCLGCDPNVIMANGQPLNDNAFTMAIGADRKHLVGHTARVTSLATGKSVMVRITDTGGFYKAKYGHRVADLTIATKTAIGMAGGVGHVRVEVY